MNKIDLESATLVSKRGKVYISVHEVRAGWNFKTIYKFLPPTDEVGTHEYMQESINLDVTHSNLTGYTILRKLSLAEILILQGQAKKRLQSISEMTEESAESLHKTLQHFINGEPH